MKTMHLFLLLVSAAGAAAAQAPLGNDAQVPPALRVRPAEPPAAGAALRAQALSVPGAMAERLGIDRAQLQQLHELMSTLIEAVDRAE